MTTSAVPPLAHLPRGIQSGPRRAGAVRRAVVTRRHAGETTGVARELPALYEDGFGSASVKDYLDRAKEMVKPDGGPPRWFCPVECRGPVIDGAPLLLFLPGMDGTGLGLILHHKPLGKVFEVRCLHIPANDRTPLEGLVELVEHAVQSEFSSRKDRPIYIVGDSLGGCLALAVAARNPTIDLVLILPNPATSFPRAQLQPLFRFLDALPHIPIPHILSFVLTDPSKLATANLRGEDLSPLRQLSTRLASLLPRALDLADVIPRETLLWRIKLLSSASSYANSRLHAVEADVLVLCGGKDSMLPSEDEGKRLWTSLKNCRVRVFKENGHGLLLEDGMNLMTVIKAMSLYRRSRKPDHVRDCLPPSASDFRQAFELDNWNRVFQLATSPVMFSTLENGMIVRGLGGVPDEGPVLLVGNHMLMGFEMAPLCEGFLREKKVSLHGLAHPMIFSRANEIPGSDISGFDLMKLFGALPASASTMYKLFSRKSFVLLYPGGAREALHRKGEEYKLFWPDQPEFVRMAARFEATIVPFGVVGEDDIVDLTLDYNDLTSNPAMKEMIALLNRRIRNIRLDAGGEISNQEIHFPGLLPKVPGRFYFCFGRPIVTRGLGEKLKNKNEAKILYLKIKSQVEDRLLYLKKKREEDPYRSVLQRAVYEAASQGPVNGFPTFEPFD